MSAVFKREFKSYFRSPVGYAVLAVMFFLSALQFTYLLINQVGEISYVFNFIASIILFIIPVLTMRLWSEEKKEKTDQLLLTSPASLSGVVMGKYFAALAMLVVGLLPMIIYMLIFSSYTKPNWGMFSLNFLAIFLLGAAFIAIGLFISSLTESQIVSVVVSFLILYVIMMIDTISSLLPSWLGSITSALSFTSKYNDMSSGILNFSNVLFFLSIAVIFNFLTVRVLEKKRWS